MSRGGAGGGGGGGGGGPHIKVTGMTPRETSVGVAQA